MNAPTPQATSAARPPLFGAILEPPRRRRWPWVVLIAGLSGLSIVAAVHRTAGATNVMTPTGVHTVRTGMTTGEVSHLLGKPFDVRRQADGAECFKYGHPTLEMASFVVYDVCYEQGRLRDVTQKEYTASAIAPPDSPAAPQQPGAEVPGSNAR